MLEQRLAQWLNDPQAEEGTRKLYLDHMLVKSGKRPAHHAVENS